MDSELESSLVDIGGEGDSLIQTSPIIHPHITNINSSPLLHHLQQFPNNSNNQPLSISSSPLSLSSISTTSTKGNIDSQVHGSVSTYCNKENLIDNEYKLGAPNLSAEPQKMKRSKRAGGYNLRKSLAWDRAFFTEEGVLNDSELSMITGCDRDSLCVIDEQARDSLSAQSGAICGSAYKETMEEDLSKKLQSGYPHKRNDTSSSFMKQASVSRSAQKDSPSHGLKKVVCKEVCSSPMASTSQKRLLHSTRKILTRNSKIPKFQVSKKNPPAPSTQSAGGGSNLKSCGIPQPDEQIRDSFSAQSGTICSSADVETLQEDLSKKSPSGYPNKRNATSSSFMKRDAITGGDLNSVSRSTRKGSPGHYLKKVACKEVCSTPMDSISQKTLLSSTRKILTSNSKTPKVQVSKKNPPVQSITSIQSAARGSSLKSSGIPRPVAQKSLCLKSSSNIKCASSAAKSNSELLPESIKPSSDVGNDVTNSTLTMLPFMSHKTPHTAEDSKHLDNNSSQGLLTAAAVMIKSSIGRSSNAACSHAHMDNAGLGLNRKSTEIQGNRPSGLRMPSPSLKFFSETRSPVSNLSSQTNSMPPKVLKSSIPTSRKPKVVDDTSDLRPIQVSQQALRNVDSTGKAEPCSQRTEKHSAASIVVPEVHAKVTRDNCNEQEVEVGVPIGHNNSKSSNNEILGYDNLDGVEMQVKDQVPTSSNVKGQDNKDNKLTSSHVEFEEDNYKATILFQENRTADRSMLDNSCESCPEVQLVAAYDRKREIQAQEIEFDSSIKNCDFISESQTKSTNHQNILMLASDVGSISSILDSRKTPDESSSDDLHQINFDHSMEVQVDERNSIADGKLEEDNSAVAGSQETKVWGEVTGICNGKLSVVGSSKCEHAEDEQGDIMFDSKLSNIELHKHSEAQYKTIENCDAWKRNSTNFNNYDNKDSCTVSLEVGELSSHCASTLPEVLNENPVEFYHMFKSEQAEEHPQVYRYGVVESCTSAGDGSIAYEQCSAVAEVKRPQILNNEANLNYSIVAQDSFCEINQGEINARISDDLNKVNSSAEEVKGHIDLRIHLPNCDDCSTHQTTHIDFQSSGSSSQDQVVIAEAERDTEELLCPLNEHVTLPNDESVGATLEECTGSDKPECIFSPRETDGSTCNPEGIHDEGANTKPRTDDRTLTRPPPTAVPFSDEWLAAIESAGEEILTLKTGAVKHSPPDKSIPEPSPWSPVKRKSQAIGPFDCTKHINQ